MKMMKPVAYSPATWNLKGVPYYKELTSLGRAVQWLYLNIHLTMGEKILLVIGIAACLFFKHFGKGQKPTKIKIPNLRKFPVKTLEKHLSKPNEETAVGVVEKSFLKIPYRKLYTISDDHRGRHMQVIGPTRSGKSQFLLSVAGQDMKRGMPVFFMEAKGDLRDFEQFKKLADLAGRTRDLRLFNPVNRDSMRTNPIIPVTGQMDISLANEIAQIIDRGTAGSAEGGAKYYNEIDLARIKKMTEIFLSVGEPFSLRDAFYFFTFEDCRKKALSMCKNDLLVALCEKQYGSGMPDTSSLTANLEPWASGRLGELLNSYSPEVNLEEIFTNNLLAYVAIPVGDLQVMGKKLGQMMGASLAAIAAARQRELIKSRPASIILDEFAQFATPNFMPFVSTVGSVGMRTIFSHQDLGQLQLVVGVNPKSFESNIYTNTSGCKVLFQLPYPDDSELFARAIGTIETAKATERVEAGMFGSRGTGDKSVRMVEEFIAHPNMLRTLPPGVAVVAPHGRPAKTVVTAKVHELLKDRKPVELPNVAVKSQKGLHLESEIKLSKRC